MTLVTIDELVDYMGGFKLTDRKARHVGAVVLPGVQGELETHLNRTVETIQVRERLCADFEGFLYFGHTPVIELRSVVRSDGVTIPVPATYRPPPMDPVDDVERQLDLTTINYSGDSFRLRVDTTTVLVAYRPLLLEPVTYIVEYLAGFTGDIARALTLDILRVTAREVEGQWDESMSLRGNTTESASKSDERPKGWTDDELAKWDRYRRRAVV